MSSQVSSAPSKRLLWAGRVVSAVPVLMLLISAAMKFTRSPEVAKQFVDHLGYREGALLGIGVLELVSVILYVVPQTSVLGAILLTGYLGGAVATHVRVGDAFVIPVALGVLVWLGLYLRDVRIRALLPLRK